MRGAAEVIKETQKSSSGDNIINISDKMKDNEIEEAYNFAVNRPQCSAHRQIHNPTVYLWAFEGHSFEAKPPCIRCTYLYHSWNLAERPETAVQKKKALAQLQGYQMEYHDNKSPPCGYCAETTAAAQLFALDCGPIICYG